MMKKRNKIVLAAVALALAGGTGVAGLAYADGGPGWGKGWGRGGPGQGHMMEMFQDRYDANKDGKISKEEVDTNRTTTFDKFDGDKDKNLTLSEFEKLWLEANRKRMVREFQRFDVDGDAKVTLDEYKEPVARMVDRMDRNKDGVIGPEDRPPPDRMGMMGHRRGMGGPGMGGPGGNNCQPGMMPPPPPGQDGQPGMAPPPPPGDDGQQDDGEQ